MYEKPADNFNNKMFKKDTKSCIFLLNFCLQQAFHVSSKTI